MNVLRIIPCLLTCLCICLSVRADDPEERMQFADGMYVRGLYDMAVEEYLGLLHEAAGFPKMDVVLFRAGECYRQMGNKKSADEFYRRLAREFPESPQRFKGDLRRAELFVAGQLYRDAANILGELLEKDLPEDVAAPARYYLGYAQRRQFEEGSGAEAETYRKRAEEVLQEVVDHDTDSPYRSYACLELAGLLQGAGKGEDRVRDLYALALKNPASKRVAAEAEFQLAELAYAAGDFEAAAAAYERLLEKYPGDRRVQEARLQAAWSYHRAGRHEDALKLVRVKDLQDARDGSAWLYLKANCERQLGRSEEAVSTYNALVSKFPEGPHAAAAAYEKALVAFRGGDFAKAVEEAGGALSGAENEEDRHWLLAESYAEMGQPDKAREHYLLVLEQFADSTRAPLAAFRLAKLLQDEEQFAEAAGYYRKVAHDYPEHELAPDALFASAFCHGRMKEAKEALSDWSKLNRTFPSYARREEALYQQALAEIQLDKETQSGKTLRLLLKEAPDTSLSAEAHHLLAVLAEEGGKTAEAEQELREALEQKPAKSLRFQIQFRLATVLQKQDKLGEAADILQGLLSEASAEMPPALVEWLARYRLKQKAYAEAATAASTLEAVADPAPWKQIAWYLVGEARSGEGHTKEAAAAYEKALAVKAATREGAQSALAVGRLALEEKNFERAVRAYEQAGGLAQSAELIDIRAESYHGLGRTSWEQEKWEEAARYYLAVAILFDDPELTPDSLYHAAAAFAKIGREADQAKALAELKERYPSSSWARKP